MEDRVFGRRYRVTEKVGSGGMADVYKAVDETLGRTVAVKVLHPRYAADPSFAARFRQEAQAAANLQSPYIVNIYDWGQDGDTYYIVMEYVRGTDLKSIIETNGAIPSKRVAEIGAQVCSALSVAHGYDVIHRDIKPHNIMVTPDGSVKVMDFGIARAGNTTMTQTGSVMGTAHYVSPEQAQGRELKAQSDLYSLGIVLYEAVTGLLPFDADTPVAVALKQVNEKPLPPSHYVPGVDRGLEKIIGISLKKNVADRYATAEEMRRDLLAVVNGTAVAGVAAAAAGVVEAGDDDASATAVMPQVDGGPARMTAPGGPRPPAKKKRPVWPWILIAVLLIAGGLGVAWAMGLFDFGAEVPNVVGLSRAEAEIAIDAAGFTVGEVTEENSADVAAGLVISQSPEAGVVADRDVAVTLVVSKGPEMVEVPKLIGLKEAEAQQALADAGLVGSALPGEFNRSFPAGTVFAQDPQPGDKIAKGDAVRYTTSLGPEVSKVPDVIGKSRSEAEEALRAAGFKVAVREGFSDRVAKGNIYSQNPSAGLQVEKGSTVTISVSQGPSQVSVPNVMGQTEADARAELENAGFKVAVTYETQAGSGNVVNQSPAGGAKADRGSTVTITVDQPAQTP